MKSPRRNSIIAMLLGGALILVLVSLGAFPLIRGIFQDAEQLSQLKLEFAQLQDARQEANRFRAFSAQRWEDLEAIEAPLINPVTPVSFIEFLEQNAADSNLSLTIAPGTPAELAGDPWPSMDFRLSLEGAYPDMIRMLHRLENAPHLIELKNLTIQQGENQEQASLSLVIKVYTQ